jgi:hypothetical protein
LVRIRSVGGKKIDISEMKYGRKFCTDNNLKYPKSHMNYAGTEIGSPQ